MKKIMILGASILQLPAIRRARDLGLQVIAVDMNPDAIGFKEDYVIKEIISTIDIPKVIQAAKRHKIDSIITVASDMPMQTVAEVANEMGLIGITTDIALKATNKAVMRRAFEEYGVASPKSLAVSDIQDYFSAVNEIEGAAIVKPADNSGSRGIFTVSSLDDKESLEEAYNYSKKYSRNGQVMVEEYMVGPEVSVEILVVNSECHIIQVTDKLTTGAPHCVEIGHSQPSMLPEIDVEAIKVLAKRACQAVGIENGPAHAEIILTENGPKMVEIGARMGGGCITTHLVPLSTGVDMTGATIQISLGKNPDITPKINKGSAIRFIIPPIGKIVDISGVEEAQNILGIQNVEIQCKIGQTVGELESGASRIGYVIAQADTAKEAIDICEKALKKIVIKVC